MVTPERRHTFMFICALQSPVRHPKEEGSSLWTSPEKQYLDDFEPYETEGMEVNSRCSMCVCLCFLCVCMCLCVQTRGGAMCQMQLSVLFSVAPSMPLSPPYANTLFPRRAPAHVLLTVPVPRETPLSCPGRPVLQIRITTRRCF